MIAAGLLAFSTGGASAAVASPPDEVFEGTAEVIDGGDPAASVDFEPSGETELLPDDASAPAVAVAPGIDEEDDGALEQEPETDTFEPVVDGNLDAGTDSPQTPRPTSSEVAPPSPAEEPVTGSESVEDADDGDLHWAQAAPGPHAEGGQRRTARSADTVHAAAEAAPAPTPEPAPATETVPVAESTTAAQPAPAAAEPVSTQVASTNRGGAAPGDRFHVVRPAESLWSIAADLLGERATVPRIAREVNRLWGLNDDRIGTGRPDLLFAGTRLRLR